MKSWKKLRKRVLISRNKLEKTENISFNKSKWPGSQVARQRFAKPLYMGAIPISASF